MVLEGRSNSRVKVWKEEDDYDDGHDGGGDHDEG